MMIKRAAAPFVFVILILSSLCSAQDSLLTYDHLNRPPTMHELMQWEEEFTYKVKYGFFKLGTVKTTVVGDTTYQGDRLWWLQTVIKSNSSIPFVGEEENHYNSLIAETDSLPYTKLYWRDNVDEDEFKAERYSFDYKNKKVYSFQSGAPADTFKVKSKPASSGQLIFYYARLFAGVEQKYKLPVYIEQQEGHIRINSTQKAELREYEAFDHPVKTYYAEGSADFEGPFGFKGDFESWYIADDLRVPAEAHAKVWLGNVKVKLIDYQKKHR